MDFLGIPRPVWAAVCLTIGVVYTVFWPRKKASAGISPLRYFILRWAHGGVWFLLALWLALGGLTSSGLVNIVGLLALPLYLAFLIAVFAR